MRLASEKPKAVWLKEMELKTLRLGACRFLKKNEALPVNDWNESTRAGAPLTDAAEFGALACKRWCYYQEQSLIVDSIADLQTRIRGDSSAEVAMMFVVSADWHPSPSWLGLAFVRRTWANNLALDFLTQHPAIRNRITGVGIGLLNFVVDVAKKINARSIWDESTKESVGFYRKVFQRDGFDDRFSLPKSRYSWFQANRLDDSFKNITDIMDKIPRTSELLAKQNKSTLPPP